MILDGAVDENLDPVVTLQLRNDAGQIIIVVAVVDTGFNDYLSLPQVTINRTAFRAGDSLRVELADGNEVETLTCFGRVLWDRDWQMIRIQEGEGRPLVGMARLLDHRVTIDVRYNGAVRVEPIPGDDTEG